MKKIISVLLTITMVLCTIASIPLSVSAVETDVFKSGNNTHIYTDQYGTWYYQLTDDGTGYKITDFLNNKSEVEIPSHIGYLPVVEIDKHTFDIAYDVETLTIPGTITKIDDYTFKNHDILTNVIIKNGVTTIGNYAFSSCYLLKSIALPDSITTIGDFAFRNCTELTSIHIPSSVTSIGVGAFDFCNTLTDITIAPDNQSYSILDGVLFNKAQTELVHYPHALSSNSYVIPDSVTTIGEFAFSNCSALTSITIPDSVTTIGEFAFAFCFNLCNITIPDSVTSIGNRTFCYCENLTSITLPNSVASIYDYAFKGCNSLTDVYYTGSENEWNSITLSIGNDPLTNAAIHYNYSPVVAGDINGDGKIAVNDVIYLLKYIVSETELTDEQLKKADLNNDGNYTIVDAFIIQKMIIAL